MAAPLFARDAPSGSASPAFVRTLCANVPRHLVPHVYVSPAVEVIEVVVEDGFVLSPGGNGSVDIPIGGGSDDSEWAKGSSTGAGRNPSLMSDVS